MEHFLNQCRHGRSNQSQSQAQTTQTQTQTSNQTHVHSENLPKMTGKNFASAPAQSVVISEGGQTLLLSGSFSGCIGVIMRGTRPWGAVAHLHQNIQRANQSLALALSTLADFIRNQTSDEITEVLLYYGDAGDNQGEKQNPNDPLTVDRVKELMGCGSVIDRRRTEKFKDPHGDEFIYDPGSQTVYTTSTGGGHNGLLKMLDFTEDADENIIHDITKPFTPYLYPDDATKNQVIGGLGGKGWYTVP
jgi:hypothetical protein